MSSGSYLIVSRTDEYFRPGHPDATSFLLVMARDDQDLGMVEQRLRRRLGDDVEIATAAEVKQNDLDLLVKIFAIPLQMMVGIAFAVGTAILGMIIYTTTVSRAQEYGVLKAVGTKNRQLYGLALLQALFIAVTGVILGLGLAHIAAEQVMEIYPKFLIVFDAGDVLPVIGAGLGMGLLAAYLPARFLGQLDPVQIFRK